MEKKDENKTQNTFLQFEKQLVTLETIHEQLSIKHKEQKRNVDLQKNQFRNEINRLKHEFSEIEELCQQLNRNIFFLGHILKQKITSFEFEELKTKIDEKTYENYIRYDELENTYSRYANK